MSPVVQQFVFVCFLWLNLLTTGAVVCLFIAISLTIIRGITPLHPAKA